jgi:hypothetical protein
MKKLISLLVIVCFISIASLAHARTAKMIFWYPGEAGSTEEAQGLLDELFEYLKKKNSKLKIEGVYFNTVDDGKSYIRNDKPALGIISYPAYVMNKDTMSNATVILATLLRPAGKKSETYVIVGAKPLADNDETIYMSEPLSRAFITEHLYPDLPASLKLEQTSSVMGKLKKIGEGKLKGYALLTPIQFYTLSKMSADWAKEFTRTDRAKVSKPIPSARFVMFGNYPEKNTLIETLMGMQNDPDGKAILEELRLTGFAKP